MTQRFQRYAIYWTPEPDSNFAAFGKSWFAAPASFGLSSDLAARAVKSPARYGLHATLKAPFRLHDGARESDLQQALDSFCAVRRAPKGGALMLARFQGYLGLVLSRKTSDIDWLAAECVTGFDRFRAPLDESDRDRREHHRLSPAEASFFETFGYPYVLSEFQFHVSLAGPLDDGELGQVAEALEPHVAPFMKEKLKIQSLSLLGEANGGGAFEVISRHRFRHGTVCQEGQEC